MDTPSDEPGGGVQKAQTRFKFYNPEEVHSASMVNDTPLTSLAIKEAAAAASNRFPFSNAEDLHKTAPLHLPKPIDLTSLGAKTSVHEVEETRVEPKDEPPHDSTTQNILRSLLETEREQQIFKGSDHSKLASRRFVARQQSNPYEAAIHDALAMLRSNRSRQPPQSVWKVEMDKNDRLLEHRATILSQVQESESRSCEERLDMGSSKTEEDEGRVVPVKVLSQMNSSQQLVGQVPRSLNKLEKAYSTEEASRESLEEEVQRGVERILMAILDRAHGRDDLSRDRIDSNDDLTKALSTLLHPGIGHDVETLRVKPPSRRLAEEYLTDDEGDVDEGLDDSGSDGEVDFSQDSTMKVSVAEELLAEDVSDRNLKPPPNMMELPTSPHTIFSKLSMEQCDDDADDEDEGDVNSRSDFAALVEDDDDESELLQSETLTQVLGPLSGRNTTGVVLESSRNVVDTKFDDSDDEVAAVTTQIPTILESLSSVVKDAENFMSYMVGAVSPTNSCTKPDNFLTQDLENSPQYRSADLGETSADAEANELMRSLCAHLLPYGVDKSTKHLSEIPPWDDLNPNEPGYRIIRLSKSQLRRVESEFERMVNGVKLSSERYLGNKRHTDADILTPWNAVAVSSYDENFEKDLEEAENLLDRDEMLQAAAEKEKRLSDEEETGNSEGTTSDADETSLSCHPDFPGVQRSGKGEMGDLEYFNLPIIFKSHVTGFEPTKDLFLEPGNVVAGQYLVENELGSAAFSTAYRCIDLNSDVSGDGEFHEELCLKVIKNTKDFFDQSLDEIKILELLRQTGKCNENNILAMKCFFYHREHLIIVTELLRQNLFEFGKFIIDNNEEQYFTIRRLSYVTRQVLVALKFVHALGLVHSDVKPENILLSSYSRAKVKLIDFGSSCYLTDRQSSYIQSRSYRAPEVVLGLPYDGKIDVWSLGCVVAEMYTSEVTFQNDSIVSMLSRIEAICGPFPRHMIAQGRQSSRFFSKSGLLYELVEPDETRISPVQDDDESGLFDVFQPKRTNWASRLGFDPNFIQQPMTTEAHEQSLFVDFCQSLLTIDPDSRPTAAQALQHPWIVASESLTEDDIKYPSS